MSAEPEIDQVLRLRQERDLYKRLLTLGAEDEMERFLHDALALIVEVTGARHGYLELRDGDAGEAFSTASDYTDDELVEVRAASSRGILAQALASNQTVVTDTGWNMAETARRLDLARSHVYNLVKAFGLERKKD